MTFSNKVYTVTKFFAQLFFPAVATLYAALAQIWNWPYVTQVVASISAFDAFLGGLLYISSAGYKPQTDGVVHIDQSDPTRNVMTMDLKDPLGFVQNPPQTVLMEVRGAPLPPATIQTTVKT
jgi:hypothetical protein